MLFSHDFDNWKTLGIILRSWRLEADLSQDALAQIIKVPRALVNAAENLDSLKSSKIDTRKVTRETLLKIVSGLILSDLEQKMDLVLGLFDGQFLTPKEKATFIGRGKADSKSRHREKPLENMLELLKEALDIFERKGKKSREFPAKVIGYRDDHEDKKDAVGEALFSMEKLQGVHLLRRPLPSFIILKNLVVKNGSIERKKKREHEVGLDRLDLFFKRIDEFGERSIHEKGAILTYLQTDNSDVSLEQRKAQIEVLIHLLQTNDRFQIRLAETASPFTFQIAGLTDVIVSPPGYSRHIAGFETKESFSEKYVKRLKLHREEFVLPFIIDFETEWIELSKKQPDNRAVIKVLESLLDKAE